MSSSGSPTNYKDTFFEYPDGIKIHGQPSLETLIQLKKELKANAASVPSNLSDGLNRHLGTVLNPPSYALVSDVPFVPPVHPGPLVIPPGAGYHRTYGDGHERSPSRATQSFPRSQRR
jgi:hypothetical protein